MNIINPIRTSQLHADRQWQTAASFFSLRTSVKGDTNNNNRRTSDVRFQQRTTITLTLPAAAPTITTPSPKATVVPEMPLLGSPPSAFFSAMFARIIYLFIASGLFICRHTVPPRRLCLTMIGKYLITSSHPVPPSLQSSLVLYSLNS